MSPKNAGSIIKNKRKREGITLERMAESIGLSNGYLSMVETGKRIPSDTLLRRIANRLHLSYEELRQLTEKERLDHQARKARAKFEGLREIFEAGREPDSESNSVALAVGNVYAGMVPVPVLGSAPGGEPLYVDPISMSEAEFHIAIPCELISDTENTFAIKVSGNSMSGRVEDGDLVVVQRGLKPANGDIALVKIAGQFTIKAVEYLSDMILLRSTNGEITSIAENYKDDSEIVGKVILKITQNP